MTFPVALIIMGAVHWPVTLVLALLVAVSGATRRGGWRVVCFIIAGVLLVPLVLGLPLLAEWRSAAPV